MYVLLSFAAVMGFFGDFLMLAELGKGTHGRISRLNVLRNEHVKFQWLNDTDTKFRFIAKQLDFLLY